MFRKQETTFRNRKYIIDYEYIAVDGSEFTTTEIDNRNLNRLLNEYRRELGLQIVENLDEPVVYPPHQ